MLNPPRLRKLGSSVLRQPQRDLHVTTNQSPLGSSQKEKRKQSQQQRAPYSNDPTKAAVLALEIGAGGQHF